MVTLDELCILTAGSSISTAPLRQTCAQPRSPVDMSPLPVPHAAFAFDSSWEALFTGTDVLAKPDE